MLACVILILSTFQLVLQGCGFAFRYRYLPNLVPSKVQPTEFSFVSLQGKLYYFFFCVKIVRHVSMYLGLSHTFWSLQKGVDFLILEVCNNVVQVIIT